MIGQTHWLQRSTCSPLPRRPEVHQWQIGRSEALLWSVDFDAAATRRCGAVESSEVSANELWGWPQEAMMSPGIAAGRRLVSRQQLRPPPSSPTRRLPLSSMDKRAYSESASPSSCRQGIWFKAKGERVEPLDILPLNPISASDLSGGCF
jgi:hypothetical protein